MGFGRPPVSPFIFEARDHQGHTVKTTIPYDNTTKAINGNTLLHRDPTCVYTKLVIGNPAHPIATIPAPAGDSTVTAAHLAATGITSINTIINTQITAGP